MMFGILAISGDLGCSLGPWIAGAISDYVQKTGRTLTLWNTSGMAVEQIGLRSGLLAAVIFPLLIAVSLLIFRKKSKRQVN